MPVTPWTARADDVAIMGCSNNEPVCEMCTPPLSSVQLDAERVGYEAAKLLDRIMKDPSCAGGTDTDTAASDSHPAVI